MGERGREGIISSHSLGSSQGLLALWPSTYHIMIPQTEIVDK